MKAFGIGLAVWGAQTFAALSAILFLYFAYIAPTNGAPLWGFVADVLLFVVFGACWVAALRASGKDVLALNKRLEAEAEAEAIAASRGRTE